MMDAAQAFNALEQATQPNRTLSRRDYVIADAALEVLRPIVAAHLEAANAAKAEAARQAFRVAPKQNEGGAEGTEPCPQPT